MIRSLTVVAVGGALLSMVCFGSSAAIHHISWHVPGLDWRIDDDDSDGPSVKLSGREQLISRTLAWAGGSAIDISVPAEVTYTQGPATAIVLTGPDVLVNHTVLDGNTLKLNAGVHHFSTDHPLHIAITAPGLHDFSLESAQSLDIQNLATDHLSVTIDGAGKVSAHGTAKSVKLQISGAGDAQLGNLTVQDADIEIDGFGNVVAAPTGDAKVQIDGAGNVSLTKRPAHLTQDINGGGHVSQPDAPAEEKL